MLVRGAKIGVDVYGDDIFEEVSRSEGLLSWAYEQIDLSLSTDSPELLFRHVDDVLSVLEKRHRIEPIDGVVTGAISERICEIALIQSRVKFATPRQDWQYLADFVIQGMPHNVFVSVKSFKAKERLLASTFRYPTIGFGFFNDRAEWHYDRVCNYVRENFFAIYIPKPLYESLHEKTRAVLNTNQNPFLRDLGSFPYDLQAVTDSNNLIDYTLL